MVEWQTRRTQNPLVAIPCGFESHQRHHSDKEEKMYTKEEVLNFINSRWKKDSDWTNGNCLWFAIILHKRFPHSRICYLPIEGHFITKICGVYYDATGIVNPEETVLLFSDIKKKDPSYYKRLIRDCFM